MLFLLLVSCSPKTVPTDLDDRITNLITGSTNVDISITYSQGAGRSVCYTATEDGEVWYGVATLVEGEWFVTSPSVDRIPDMCPVFEGV